MYLLGSKATAANWHTWSALGQNAKLRGDRRMSAFAPKADISRFMSTRPNSAELDIPLHAE